MKATKTSCCEHYWLEPLIIFWTAALTDYYAYWSNEEWKASLDQQLDKKDNDAQTHWKPLSNYFFFCKAVCE